MLKIGVQAIATEPPGPQDDHELRFISRSKRDRDRNDGRCRFGGWVLDHRFRILMTPAGSRIHLSKGDHALLAAFLDAPQRPLSRAHLARATRMDEEGCDRTIDVRVLRLRRKLERDPGTDGVIRTERGVGYVFCLPVEHLG